MIAALADYPAAAALLLFGAIGLSALAFWFPASVLTAMGLLCLLGGAGLTLIGLVAIRPSTAEPNYIGAFMGVYAFASAVGAVATGVMFIAAAGGLCSIRRRFR